MPHMSKLEDELKIANETKFASLGRAIADATRARTGRGVPTALLEEARLLRWLEQSQVDNQTQFAALVRQLGDAVASGREFDQLIIALVELRSRELGPAVEID
jgi:hypothetical protein